MYNLILAGFDCSNARIKKYGYNISLILRKEKITLPKLSYDYGDIGRLQQFFPDGCGEGFDGDISELNWENKERVLGGRL
jgi:hypothetical protein